MYIYTFWSHDSHRDLAIKYFVLNQMWRPLLLNPPPPTSACAHFFLNPLPPLLRKSFMEDL